MKIEYRILKDSQHTLPYLEAIRKATDANRHALGFNAVAVYEESIKKGKLWVAVDAHGEYSGHLMHGGKPPQEIRIFQIYVDESHRGSGLAKLLIDEIAAEGDRLSCLNLRADVATDLVDAVRFWQSKGFCALTTRRKKNASGREIVIFCRRLSTPSLFPQETTPLSLIEKALGNVIDSYVIDLNVFLTLIKEQTNRDLVAEIMQAAMAGEFSLFVTPEFQDELSRTKNSSDPIFDLAKKTLPVLERMDDVELERLKLELREIVFPDRSQSRKNVVQDDSDLRHLAYCIQNSKSGFVTEEKAISRAKEALLNKYGLTIYSPQDFSIERLSSLSSSPIDIPLSNVSGSVQVSEVTNAGQLRTFFSEMGGQIEEVARLFLKNSTRGVRERKVVSIGQGVCAAYLVQTKGVKHDILEGFFVSTGEQFGNREVVFEHVLECFLRQCQTVKVSSILFYVRKEDFDLEKISMARGFQRVISGFQNMVALAKVPCPAIVTKANWGEFRELISGHVGLELPRLIPTFTTNSNGSSVIHAAKNGRPHDVEVFELETLLSPSLLLLPKRTGVIVPISPGFASHLLSRADDQLPFALREEALLRLEKAYYRKPSHAKTFSPGVPIVFYESGSGRGVIGCARVTSAAVLNSRNALKLYRRYGVLDETELPNYSNQRGDVQVITFDNFKVFTKPIRMKRLLELGCAKANLVGPERLTQEQLFSIVHEGMEMHSKDVLISIQPDYVAKILSGKKTIELRKKPFPINGGMRIWIYSTNPISAIEATAFVSEIDSGTPKNIWEKYSNRCGISKVDFDSYFSGSTEAYALNISRVERLDKKIRLNEIKKLSECPSGEFLNLRMNHL